MRSRDQLVWAQALAAETDNLRAALDWAVETPSVDHTLRVVTPLTLHGIPIGHSASGWAETALALPGATDHQLYSHVASWATWSVTRRGDLALAQQYAATIDDAEARLGPGSATVCRARATLAFFLGNLETARSEGEQWVKRSRRSGDSHELSEALILLASVQGATGSRTLSRQTAEEGLQVARTAGIPSALASPLNPVAWSILAEDPERALHLLDEAMEISTQIGDPFSVAMAVQGKGVYQVSQANWDLALNEARDAIERFTQLGAAGLLRPTVGVAALALTARGHYERGAFFLGAFRQTPITYDWVDEGIANAESSLIEQLGQPRYDTLTSQGAELSAAEAITMLTATLAALQ